MVPLSGFEVVASGLFDGNHVVLGHNDEHGMTHGTFHGEDSVLHKARQGLPMVRGKIPELRTLFVVSHPLNDGKPAGGIITPCALCRGKLSRLYPEAKVVCYNPSSGEHWITSVRELLKPPASGRAVSRVPPSLQRLREAAARLHKGHKTSFDHPEAVAVETVDGRIVPARNFESAAFTSSAAAGQRLDLDPERDGIRRVWVRTTDARGAHPYTLQAILDHLGGSRAKLFEEIVLGRRTLVRATTMDRKLPRAFSRDDFA